MKILAIETSCDETAIAILEGEGSEQNARFSILGNALLSQIEIHQEYGGVFPALAKREHAKNLVPLLENALEEAELLHEDTQALPHELSGQIGEILAREPGLAEALLSFLHESEVPEIDAIAVTHGPGLAPALWVGVNFARALALAWNKPVIGVNHMEGHLLSALAKTDDTSIVIENVELPILALLISGGHTELVSMPTWLSYNLIGQTRDDAVGEAFDKVARMLGLSYPGGPEISKYAERVRESGRIPESLSLPRPMMHDNTCDFSFSGLKTAVLYLLKNKGDLSEEDKEQVAYEFENVVADVLFHKTARAIEETHARMVVLGGGVSANTHIRRIFTERMKETYPDVTLRIPSAAFTTDNAVMIGIAGYFRALQGTYHDPALLSADGNLKLV